MSVRDLPLILSSLTLPQLGRAISYALRRTWLDTSHASRRLADRASQIGPLKAAEFQGSLARFSSSTSELEIAVLTGDLLRLTWTPGELPVPYALDRSDWPNPPARWKEPSGGWEMSTPDVHLRLSMDGGISFRAPEGGMLFETQPPVRTDYGWSQRSSSPGEERLYGLGERASTFDLRGGRYRMWNSDPAGLGPGLDPLYLCVPVYMGLHRNGS